MITYVSLVSGDVEERWHLDTDLYQRFKAGRLAETRPFSADDALFRTAVQALAAMDETPLLAKLRAALMTNRAYLQKVNAGTATNADHVGQVPALTRQMVAVLLRTVAQTH